MNNVTFKLVSAVDRNKNEYYYVGAFFEGREVLRIYLKNNEQQIILTLNDLVLEKK